MKYDYLRKFLLKAFKSNLFMISILFLKNHSFFSKTFRSALLIYADTNIYVYIF